MSKIPNPVVDLSEYSFQHSTKSYCGVCNRRVHLLAPRTDPNKPFYYMCDACGQIVQAGQIKPITPSDPEMLRAVKAKRGTLWRGRVPLK